MKVSNADISKIKINLDRSIQFLEQIRGTINAGVPQFRNNTRIPIDLFIQSLRTLNLEIRDYNSYYSDQIQNSINSLSKYFIQTYRWTQNGHEEKLKSLEN